MALIELVYFALIIHKVSKVHINAQSTNKSKDLLAVYLALGTFRKFRSFKPSSLSISVLMNGQTFTTLINFFS